MIRKIFLILLTLTFLASAGYAKKEKTVKIKDMLATDLKYGWKMPVPDNWKAKNQDEPNVERLFLEQKNYRVNPNISQYGGDYTIPRVIIYVQEFGGTVDDFENLIKKSLEEHRTDNEIISKMGLLQDGDYIVSADVTRDSSLVRQIYLKRNYKRLLYIPDSGGGISGGREEYINDHEVHEVYLIKHGSYMLVFQAFFEREFYDSNAVEFQAMMKSLEF